MVHVFRVSCWCVVVEAVAFMKMLAARGLWDLGLN